MAAATINATTNARTNAMGAGACAGTELTPAYAAEGLLRRPTLSLVEVLLGDPTTSRKDGGTDNGRSEGCGGDVADSGGVGAGDSRGVRARWLGRGDGEDGNGDGGRDGTGTGTGAGTGTGTGGGGTSGGVGGVSGEAGAGGTAGDGSGRRTQVSNADPEPHAEMSTFERR